MGESRLPALQVVLARWRAAGAGVRCARSVWASRAHLVGAAWRGACRAAFGEPVADHQLDRVAVGVAGGDGGVKRAAVRAAAVAVPGAVVQVDAARGVAVASAVCCGLGEAAHRGLGARPPWQVHAERGVVAADVGAGEREGHGVPFRSGCRRGGAIGLGPRWGADHDPGELAARCSGTSSGRRELHRVSWARVSSPRHIASTRSLGVMAQSAASSRASWAWGRAPGGSRRRLAVAAARRGRCARVRVRPGARCRDARGCLGRPVRVVEVVGFMVALRW